jgi:hypothetical protein
MGDLRLRMAYRLSGINNMCSHIPHLTTTIHHLFSLVKDRFLEPTSYNLSNASTIHPTIQAMVPASRQPNSSSPDWSRLLSHLHNGILPFFHIPHWHLDLPGIAPERRLGGQRHLRPRHLKFRNRLFNQPLSRLVQCFPRLSLPSPTSPQLRKRVPKRSLVVELNAEGSVHEEAARPRPSLQDPIGVNLSCRIWTSCPLIMTSQVCRR